MVTPHLWLHGPGIDAYRRRQTGAQVTEPCVGIVERDADRHALNDLRKIAGGVFRRDHAENRTGAGRQALDMAVERLARQDVGYHRRRLARSHLRELVFLEIGIDPEPLRRDRRSKDKRRPRHRRRPAPARLPT